MYKKLRSARICLKKIKGERAFIRSPYGHFLPINP